MRAQSGATGIPEWAPQSSDPEPAYYVWVEADGGLRTTRSGAMDEAAVRRRCEDVIGGTDERRWGEPPHDLAQQTAFARITARGVGYGGVGRPSTRPLGDLLERALRDLSNG